MVNSALDARRQREREALRLVETLGNPNTIKEEDEEGVDSEGDVKMEVTPMEQLDDPARSSASDSIAAATSADGTGDFMYRRRTFTLLLTEHSSRRTAPYVVPAPRSVSEVRSLLAHFI